MRRHSSPLLILFISFLMATALAQMATHTLSGHTGGIVAVAFSPDGRTLVTCSDANEPARVWEATTGTPKMTLKEKAAAVAFFPDGKRIVLASRDADNKGAVQVIDASSGEVKLALLGHTSPVQSVAVSPDGNLIASKGGAIKVWDAQNGELRMNLESSRGAKVVFSADSKLIATDTRDGVRLWEVETGQMKLDFDHVAANSLALSPDGKLLATASGGVIAGLLQGEVKLWEVETGELKRTVKNLTTSLAFTPDGKFLAAGGSGDTFGDIKIWDVQTGDLRTTLFMHHCWVVALAFSPDGKLLASGSLDKTAKLWDVSGLK